MSRAGDLARELDRAWAENRELRARLAAAEGERDAEHHRYIDEQVTKRVVALRGDVGHAETVAGASMDHVDDLTAELAAVTAERDAARATAEHEANDVVALRAIIEGRTVAPTREEVEALVNDGGVWRFATDERSGGWCWNWPDVKAAVSHAQAIGSTLRWWAHDEDEAPRAWPVVAAPKDGAA